MDSLGRIAAMQRVSGRFTRYPLQSHVRDVIDSKVFSATMLTIIFVNTFLIALQTDRIAQMKVGTMEPAPTSVVLCAYRGCI